MVVYKKVLCMVLSVLLVISLSACDGLGGNTLTCEQIATAISNHQFDNAIQLCQSVSGNLSDSNRKLILDALIVEMNDTILNILNDDGVFVDEASISDVKMYNTILAYIPVKSTDNTNLEQQIDKVLSTEEYTKYMELEALLLEIDLKKMESSLQTAVLNYGTSRFQQYANMAITEFKNANTICNEHYFAAEDSDEYTSSFGVLELNKFVSGTMQFLENLANGSYTKWDEGAIGTVMAEYEQKLDECYSIISTLETVTPIR